MRYVEEREFSLRLVVRCEFPDDYEGELDGYEWAAEMPDIRSELFRAAVAVLQKRPGWKLRGGNRGRPTEDEMTLILERALPNDASSPAPKDN
ncbi:MAG: hypothetical protein IPK82_19720 [Polyangiaceae bacterium]|nr:hypothetical protein [Polyangiaceae bacterium]